MKINSINLKEELTDLLWAKKRRVPMIHASPGVGKSDLVRSIAVENRLKVVDLRLSQSDPTDLNGFPSKTDDGRAQYLPFEMFPIEGDELPVMEDGTPYQGWLLFLDEINSAPLSVQAAAYKVVLDRAVGQHNLHRNVVTICAGNLSEDKAIVNRMSTAMQSRLVHYQLEVDHKAWIKWGQQNDIDYRVMGFIGFKPDVLHNFNPNHNDMTFPCPRTWEFVSDIIHKFPDDIPNRKVVTLAGTVGEGAAREFHAYSKVFKTLPKLPDIVRNPKECHMPEEPSTLYAVSNFLAHNFKQIHADALCTYISRMPIEFQILAFQGALARDKELLSNANVKNWITTNSRELF